MAGVTDRPFRQICRKMGAALAVSEMLSSNPAVWSTNKSKSRMDHRGESGIRSVQIAGSEPALMANAAKFNVDNGAQIIDINMGCPAKKVNKKLAGSALLKSPQLVKEILQAVVNAVNVPVTLKIRTGWDPDNRNGVEIAKIAEGEGIQALAVHGRTRTCMFKGVAEYETISLIKKHIHIPVIANGDIKNAMDAKHVLQKTAADGLMIGRAAQGKPWIFSQIAHYLQTGEMIAPPGFDEQQSLLLEQLYGIYELYGESAGVRIARKHIGWFFGDKANGKMYRQNFNAIDSANEQIALIKHYFTTNKDKALSSVA